jgi:hypothetical protein
MHLVDGTGISPAPAAQTGSIKHTMPMVSNACPKEPAQPGEVGPSSGKLVA